MQELSDDEFQESLNSEDELGLVIRAHLHIEHWVEKLNTVMLPNYEAYAKELDPDYHSKVIIACMAGLTKDLKSPLSAFGTIRNSFAHKPSYKLTAGTADSVYKLLSPTHKNHLQVAYKNMALLHNREAKKYGSLSPSEKIQIIAMFLRIQLIMAYEKVSLT